ncbi:prenyltransferase [Lutibacter sp. HS1-25]|uniref:geranylgeranylglycerol-phosphate geranylgeranyltransferase n=1 Tax=Lutibacter sp. HS1-25 TaxID=2485000 RepID=UPI0010131A09|nr:geranylgeranylglycerol-phosphate geranylgeranyltransferase [Lutibacter sp. HS1-25]RXP61912.1 prenyltransferase [Lutibacter sp. HS1-25]
MILATYLKLVRWKNLLLIVYVFLIFKLLLFKSLHLKTILSTLDFTLLLSAVLCITAAGYIINDIFDVKCDVINKPKKTIVSKTITIETAKQWYKTTNITGVLLGVLLCLKIEKPSYAFIFFVSPLLLYFYSKKIKSKPLLGNLLVSGLTAISVVILPFFDLDFSIKTNNLVITTQLLTSLFIFAFGLNLIRELLKDIEDINGDYSLKMNTLPIVIGRVRTRNFAFVLTLFLIVFLIYIIIKYNQIYHFTILYTFFFVLAPLSYFIVKLKSAKKKKQYHNLSTLLKIIMFLGISSLIIFSITI